MAKAGNENAASHRTSSERHIRPRAANHKRRVLRQLGLSPRDLTPLARGHLDLYVRLAAKISLADSWLEEHGLLRSDGSPQPVLSVYSTWVNSARLALVRLEDTVAASRRSARHDLDAYLSDTYGDDDEAA